MSVGLYQGRYRDEGVAKGALVRPRRDGGRPRPRGVDPRHVHLGGLFRRADQREQARQHLTTAATMHREMGMRLGLDQAEAEIQKLA